ncbi:MAG: hypothetical protein ABI743_06020 [bacterium]
MHPTAPVVENVERVDAVYRTRREYLADRMARSRDGWMVIREERLLGETSLFALLFWQLAWLFGSLAQETRGFLVVYGRPLLGPADDATASPKSADSHLEQ